MTTPAKPELRLIEGDKGKAGLVREPHPEQEEMPFAMVDGEPMTQLPHDLYIPPEALQVFLEAFEGPLDLLLYLIKRQNLDILDIPIAEISKQYVEYIDLMQDLQLELAGEYLLMAAMLAEIKSRMLLPRLEGEEEDEDDPRAELIRRLLEYERYRKAAEDIDRLPRLERDIFPAEAGVTERKVVEFMPDIVLQELLLSLKEVMSRAEMFAHLHVQREPLSVRQRMSDLLSKLQSVDDVAFSEMFSPEEGRAGVIVSFLALLELLRETLIEIVQKKTYGPIRIRAAGARIRSVKSEFDA